MEKKKRAFRSWVLHNMGGGGRGGDIEGGGGGGGGVVRVTRGESFGGWGLSYGFRGGSQDRGNSRRVLRCFSQCLRGGQRNGVGKKNVMG